MSESTQQKLGRVRPPRVQITYDVEIGGAIVMKQLPFVVGMMADLSGKPEEPLPPLKKRKFVFVDRDNVDQVLASAAPRLAFQVPNKLGDDPANLNLELKFKEMDDFLPINVVKQVPALKSLFDSRQRLVDLLGKLDGNDELDKLMQEFIRDESELKTLADLAMAGSEEKEEAKGAKGAKDSKKADDAVESAAPEPEQKEDEDKAGKSKPEKA
ncbi:type VI secretion system contractile sheath small subunit [Maridesulfovibrio zosterae]|uniref:type VI secretion system contractile sheath small subunit n=1 Tax=Maridesulfovibrio zosterae TaxID=82171 RepID=UPI000411EB54|nr:type VI secretion system contractile sheath small subunit [Maridesulfovibrio zosterae]